MLDWTTQDAMLCCYDALMTQRLMKKWQNMWFSWWLISKLNETIANLEMFCQAFLTLLFMTLCDASCLSDQNSTRVLEEFVKNYDAFCKIPTRKVVDVECRWQLFGVKKASVLLIRSSLKCGIGTEVLIDQPSIRCVALCLQCKKWHFFCPIFRHKLVSL